MVIATRILLVLWWIESSSVDTSFWNLNDRIKHIDIRHHFIREKVQQEEVAINMVSSGENLADVLTKPLAREVFERMRALLGVQPSLLD